ncbi:MAG TPA: hypothetical protein VGP48_10800 [Stellaceae bacterium]|jgi:hypothetical protein|nr:hypothetical protein [Stellaceae bacterium]
MAVIYVARSAALSKWASDVGLSKNIFKVGIADEPIKELIAEGWAGETDWTLVKKDDAGELTDDVALERLARRETAIDPKYYPRIRDTRGLFKVNPVHVESHIIVGRALEGGSERLAIKLKPADFAAYLIHNARR